MTVKTEEETALKIESVNIEVSAPSTSLPSTSNLDKIFDDDSDSDVQLTGVFAPPSLEEQVNSELTKYKTMGKISMKNDPLEFWRLYRGSLPHLSEVALKYLCVQASSVPSERVFSTAGDTVTAERSRLDPSKVDMVIFLKKNA